MEINDGYRHSHTAVGKGEDYEENFKSFSWRAYLWGREQAVLRELLSANHLGKKHLDFACGTGRIMGFVEQFGLVSTGIDVSRSMLKKCREKMPKATLIEADITSPIRPDLSDFEIITAFRFFPNAEEQLRVEVLTALRPLLTDEGILIFNNHKNSSNLYYWFAKIIGKEKRSMSVAEVRNLVTACGFTVKRVVSMGVLPSDERFMVGPKWLNEALERFVEWLGASETLCQNNIYVCTKAVP